LGKISRKGGVLHLGNNGGIRSGGLGEVGFVETGFEEQIRRVKSLPLLSETMLNTGG
jgi:hypothetical protein